MTNRTCTIPECGNPLLARGWCGAHYARWRRGRDPLELVRKETRFGKRKCARCQTAVDLDKFYNDKSSWCRPCSAKAKRDKYAPIAVPLPLVFCVECGTKYSPTRRTNITCSDKCSKQRKTRFNRQGEMTRRALLTASYVELVDSETVYQRDAWICQLCHDPIDSELVWPNSKSPSVDHVVPLNRGGEHSYKNCQAAHLGCNAGKQDRYIG